jgi:hypothetical protein
VLANFSFKNEFIIWDGLFIIFITTSNK